MNNSYAPDLLSRWKTGQCLVWFFITTLNLGAPKNEINSPQINTAESTFILHFLVILFVLQADKKMASCNSFSLFNVVEEILFTSPTCRIHRQLTVSTIGMTFEYRRVYVTDTQRSICVCQDPNYNAIQLLPKWILKG